jgi:hypothetical protein
MIRWQVSPESTRSISFHSYHPEIEAQLIEDVARVRGRLAGESLQGIVNAVSKASKLSARSTCRQVSCSQVYWAIVSWLAPLDDDFHLLKIRWLGYPDAFPDSNKGSESNCSRRRKKVTEALELVASTVYPAILWPPKDTEFIDEESLKGHAHRPATLRVLPVNIDEEPLLKLHGFLRSPTQNEKSSGYYRL